MEPDPGPDPVPGNLVGIGIAIAIDIAVGLIAVVSNRPFPNCIATPSEFCQHRNNPVKESCSYQKAVYILFNSDCDTDCASRLRFRYRFRKAQASVPAIHPSPFPEQSTQNFKLQTSNSSSPFPKACVFSSAIHPSPLPEQSTQNFKLQTPNFKLFFPFPEGCGLPQ
jgi:hypothetical protein